MSSCYLIESIVYSSRTTICDIMCTTNTNILYKEPREIPVHIHTKAQATLPYANEVDKIRKFPAGTTDFTKFRNIEIKDKKSNSLKKEKSQFFEKLREEKIQKDNLRNESAILIQKIFRGYCARPKPSYRPKRMGGLFVGIPVKCDLNDLHTELCKYSRLFGLKPIPGLNLEYSYTLNKRKNRIRCAAIVRLQCFFRMVLCRLRYRMKCRTKAEVRKKRSIKNIQRFGRYCLRVKLLCEENKIQRHASAKKIQTRMRMFFAQRKVRRLKKEKELQRRRNDAAVVIQRALALKYKRLRINLVNNRIVSPPNAKQSTTAGKNAETTRHGSRSPSRANRAKK